MDNHKNNRLILPPHHQHAMNRATNPQKYPLADAVLKDGFGLVEYIENVRICGGDDPQSVAVALLKIAGAGWDVVLDPSVPEGRAVVTIACHLSRDFTSMNLKSDRILRLGSLFGPALAIVKNSLVDDGKESTTEEKEDTQ